MYVCTHVYIHVCIYYIQREPKETALLEKAGSGDGRAASRERDAGGETGLDDLLLDTKPLQAGK
jgi:hypothetical protein